MSLRWLFAVGIPVVAILLFWLVLPTAYRTNESGDYESFYGPVAHQLVAGRGFTMPDGNSAVRYPPGYPVIVASVITVGNTFGLPEPLALDIFTLVCCALSSLFLFWIARDLFAGWFSLVPSAAWSTYPLGLWLTKQPNSEVPFTTLLFGMALLVWRLTHRTKGSLTLAALAGALAGISMLIRPISLFMPVLLAGLVWLLGTVWPRRTRLALGAVIVVSGILIVVPWEIYASRAEGRFVLLGTNGIKTIRDGLSFGVNPDKTYRSVIYVPEPIRTVMIDFYAQYDRLTSLGVVVRACWHELVQHPVGMAGLVAFKSLRAWYATDSQRIDRYILLLQLVYIAGLIWTVCTAWKTGGDIRCLVILVCLPLSYFWIMSVVGYPMVRYMVPGIGLAMLLAPTCFERSNVARGIESSVFDGRIRADDTSKEPMLR